MKKGIIIFVLLFNVLIIFKYLFSDYELSYKVNNYSIYTHKYDDTIYYELSGKYKFNFSIYSKKGRSSSIITSLKVIEKDNLYCVFPVIKGIDTYPLCMLDNVYTDYHIIDNELLSEYKNEEFSPEKSDTDYVYYNNLDSSTYIALWNYKGYYVMNGKEYKNYSIIEKDRYDNTLAFMRNSFIYMPNYDQDHEFDQLIKFNILDGETETIELNTKIDYDSYIVGTVKNSLYIFENKSSTLYEFNFRKNELSVLGSNKNGYVKYEKGEFVTCSKGEYINNKITYSDVKKDDKFTYKLNEGLFKTIKDNNKLSQKLLNDNVILINNYKDILYYVKDNFLFRYNPNRGHEKILYNFELNFNNTNTIFIYNQ